MSCDYLKTLVANFDLRRVKVGVYSTSKYWRTVFGSNSFCSVLSGKPLWYGDNNEESNFDGFISFGGWTQPTLKTHTFNTTSICGINVNLNWSPSNN